jgi:hypothetical protein
VENLVENVKNLADKRGTRVTVPLWEMLRNNIFLKNGQLGRRGLKKQERRLLSAGGTRAIQRLFSGKNSPEKTLFIIYS